MPPEGEEEEYFAILTLRWVEKGGAYTESFREVFWLDPRLSAAGRFDQILDEVIYRRERYGSHDEPKIPHSADVVFYHIEKN